MAATATLSESGSRRWSHAADKVTLHPVIGPILLAAIMFVMFQAVFAWAERPMALIEEAIGALQAGIAQVMPDGFVQSPLADGVLAGVGPVEIGSASCRDRGCTSVSITAVAVSLKQKHTTHHT